MELAFDFIVPPCSLRVFGEREAKNREEIS